MKQLFLFLCSFLWLTAQAQETQSRLIDRATPVDTARYKVTYSLKYKYHPDIQDYFTDTRIVQIGKRKIKDYSDIIHHFDSLATEQVRCGADAYSNVSGMPWPVEITRPQRGAVADMKRRLDLIGNFIYQDSVPALEWQFVPDETAAILGYECAKAKCEFAGRSYSAWFTQELPLPFGPYKLGGLPGLILKIEDAEQQFVWEAVGFERSAEPIFDYTYQDGNDNRCTASDVAKAVERYFNAPYSFMIAQLGGDASRLYVTGKDGKRINAADLEKISIPYKPLEMK